MINLQQTGKYLQVKGIMLIFLYPAIVSPCFNFWGKSYAVILLILLSKISFFQKTLSSLHFAILFIKSGIYVKLCLKTAISLLLRKLTRFSRNYL